MSANSSSELIALESASSTGISLFNSLPTFKAYLPVAELLARGSILPDEYRNNPANCLLALDISIRAGMPFVSVVQNLQVVHGKPGWSGKYVIAVINTCGRFEELQFEWVSEQGNYEWGCRAWTYRKGTQDRINGPWVTWKMAFDEGWVHNPESKWNTMPELMFQYRAGSFFGNLRASDLLLGIPTVEDLHDIQSRIVNTARGTTLAELDLTNASTLSAALKEIRIETPAEVPQATSLPSPTVLAPATDATSIVQTTGATEASMEAPSRGKAIPTAKSQPTDGAGQAVTAATTPVEQGDLLSAEAGAALPLASSPGAASNTPVGAATCVPPSQTGAADASAPVEKPVEPSQDAEWPDTPKSKQSVTAATAPKQQTRGSKQAAKVQSAATTPAAATPATSTPNPAASEGSVKQLISDLPALRQLLVLAKKPSDLLIPFQQLKYLQGEDRIKGEKDAIETAMEFIAEEKTQVGMDALKVLAQYIVEGGNLVVFRAAYNGRVETLREMYRKS